MPQLDYQPRRSKNPQHHDHRDCMPSLAHVTSVSFLQVTCVITAAIARTCTR